MTDPIQTTAFECRPVARPGWLRMVATVLTMVTAVWAGPGSTGAWAQAQPQVQIQVQTQAKQIWPALYEGQWHWHEAQSNLSAPEVTAILRSIAQERPLFEAPKYVNAVFTVWRMKVETKSKVTGVKVEGEWRSTVNSKKGFDDVFVPLDSMTAAVLWYMTTAAQLKWKVHIHPAPTYRFHFATEQSARRFINAIASARTQHAQPSMWLKFGMMIQDLTPEQAEDAGRPRVDSVYAGMVAFNGPADLGGIQPNDVILEFNGKAVLNEPQFEGIVAAVPPGTSVPVTLLRRIRAPEGAKPSYTWERKTLSIVAK